MSSPEAGVVLVGLPGSGKTLVGRCLAERTGRRSVDTDELVRHRTGSTPAEHIARDGEQAFRTLEAEAVAAACAEPGTIVVTGGGAVLDPLTRWALWHHGTVAWLDAPPDALAERLRMDPEPRPLLSALDAPTLSRLADARRPFYAAADLRLDSTRDPGDLATALAEAFATTGRRARRLYDAQVPRHHPLGPTRARIVYGVDLGRDTVNSVLDGFPDRRPSLVADRRAADAAPRLVAALAPARRLDITAGERAKRLRTVERVVEWLASERAERGDPLIAFGGGTTGDLAGMAAAVFARGVPLVHVPTTWLAQADSALGGKVGVDLAGSKNAVGAFWPPVAVLADIGALRSLPQRRLRDGVAEALKSGLIGDPTLWRLIEARGRAALRDDEAARYAITERAARLKLDICARDPYETGERRTLNLGHTLGHALEVESGYRLPHGQAVALGLRAVASIAAERGAEPHLAERIDDVLSALGFRLRRRFDPSVVRRALRSDKKRERGRQRWILPMAVGRVTEVDDVTDAELAHALRHISEAP
jgi:3-dehydroquinate synthetase